jgi:hypothetical protein
MYLYPVPALMAGFGFLYVLFKRPDFMKEIRYAMVIVVAGLLIYLMRSWQRKEWPFSGRPAHNIAGAPVQ